MAMSGLIGLFRKFPIKFKKVEKEGFQQFCDNVSIVTVTGICLQCFIIKRNHWKTPENNPLTGYKYVLVGNKLITEQVEHEIRRKLGEPRRPLFLMKWYYTDIAKIDKVDQFEKLTEQKPITLYLCASVKNEPSQTDFCLPEELPSNIKKKNVILVKSETDQQEDVQKRVTSLCGIKAIKDAFEDTMVLQFAHDQNSDCNFQSEMALIQITVLVLAALISLKNKKAFYSKRK